MTVRDHYLLVDFHGQRAFIDTGSPVTVARNGFEFEGRRWPDLMRALQGSRVWASAPELVSQKLEVGIDALVGMDLLKEYSFEADFEAREFVMSREPLLQEGFFYRLIGPRGASIMTVQLQYGHGETMLAYVDTGAKQSFILERHTNTWPDVGAVDDFSPFIGDFTARRHRIPVQIADKEFTLDFAVMPKFYEDSGMMRGAGAVLGNDLWEHFQVTYSPPENGLWLRPPAFRPA